MSPSTTRRATADRADRRTAIEQRLREAIERLVSAGETFTAVSVERLVAEAGMSRSTFYVYFEDKGALLRALETASMSRLGDGARVWFDRGLEATRDDVLAAMRAILDSFREDEVIMLAVSETAVYDAAVRDHYRRGVDEFISALTRLIRNGRRAGRIREVRPAETAAALAWMIERTVQQTAPGTGPRELDAIAEGLADVVWGALYAGAP